MATDESNRTRFTSETLMPNDESLINSFQNLQLEDLGFVECNQTGAEEDCCAISCAGPSSSAGFSSEHVMNPASQWEGWGVQERCVERDRAMNGNGLLGCVCRFSLFDHQGKGIWSMNYVGNQIDAERFKRPYGHGYACSGSNSITSMQFPDQLSGGLAFHGAQPSRTPSPEEYLGSGNVVLDNNSGFGRGDLVRLHELSDGDIQVLATHPCGWKSLEGILARRDPLAMGKILNGVLKSVFNIMMDEFGSKLFKKLLESCNEYQVEKIVASVIEPVGLLIDVANSKHGDRSVRKLVKMVKRSDRLILCVTLALIPGFRALATNPHGSNVIKFLTQVYGSHYPLVYDAIIENCLALAVEVKGCLTLNVCINNSTQPFRDILLNIISDNTVFLSQDPYGNFVVQHVLGLEIPEITSKICLKLRGSYVRLSMQKSGSHVVESCLKSSGRNHAIWELANSDKLDQLARDQFGNYVIQTALESAAGRGQVGKVLMKAIKERAPSLRSHLYGRNVFNSLTKDHVISH